MFFHNASGMYGSIPLDVSGDIDINPDDGEYRLSCQVFNFIFYIYIYIYWEALSQIGAKVEIHLGPSLRSPSCLIIFVCISYLQCFLLTLHEWLVIVHVYHQQKL